MIFHPVAPAPLAHALSTRRCDYILPIAQEGSIRAIEKLGIGLPPDLFGDVRESVESGEFSSTSEATQDAIRIWKRQREEDAERLARIRARIRRSLDDPRPDMTLREVDAHLAALFERAE